MVAAAAIAVMSVVDFFRFGTCHQCSVNVCVLVCGFVSLRFFLRFFFLFIPARFRCFGICVNNIGRCVAKYGNACCYRILICLCRKHITIFVFFFILCNAFGRVLFRIRFEHFWHLHLKWRVKE